MSNDVEAVKTMVELAKILNVTQPRISQLKKQGMPVQGDGSYNIKEITTWRVLRATEKVKTMLPSVISDSDKQVVNVVMGELNRFKELVDDFKKDRGDIFAGVEAKLISVVEDILDSVNKNDILLIPLKDRLRFVKDIVSSVSGLYEKERLERDLSTDNVAVIVAQIKDLKRRKFEERERESKTQNGNQSN